MAIALVAIGLTVSVLGYTGYQDWAWAQSQRTNALALTSAVTQARSHGIIVDGNGNVFPLVVTASRANQIFSQISGPISTGGGLAPGTVEILPVGFALKSGASLPSGWHEVSPGLFEEPIP